MAQQAPVQAPGQMAPPMSPAQQAPAAPPPPPSLFKQPLAPEFAPTPAPDIYGGMTPGEALGGALTMKQPQPQPDQNLYGGMSPGDALGGGLAIKQSNQQQQQPQMSQLLSVMPADFAAQITPAQLAALTPDQMTQMIAKFSQPQTPDQTTIPVMPRDYRPPDMYSTYANTVFGSNAPSPQFQPMNMGKM